MARGSRAGLAEDVRKKLIEVALLLEAQRLGLEAYASDLNPVAVLINKTIIEVPPRFAGRHLITPEVRTTLPGSPAPNTSAGTPASSRHLTQHLQNNEDALEQTACAEARHAVPSVSGAPNPPHRGAVSAAP